MDLYEVFGLPTTATDEDVQKRYRKLAMQHHPDRNPGDAVAVEKFKAVQNAYEILGDSKKRSSYDLNGRQSGNKRHSRPPQQDSHSEFFHSVFNTFFCGEDKRRHIQMRLELDLGQLLKDDTHTIFYSKRQACKSCRGSGVRRSKTCRQCHGNGQVVQIADPPFEFFGPCPTCGGSGKIEVTKCNECVGSGFGTLKDCTVDVKIPAGIHHGMQVRVQGAGEEGGENSLPGDLFVVVLTKSHSFFRREIADLWTEIPVSYSTLVLGGDILIPTLEKTFVSVKVPAGTQPNTRFRLKARGLPDFRVSNKWGDLLATVKLEVPIAPGHQYVQALEQVRLCEKAEPTPKIDEWLRVTQDT